MRAGSGMGSARASPKSRLPDAHNDFVFAAMAEEMGIAACLFLILIYALIVWRALRGAFREQETFVRLAAAGLVMIFGLQALINMAVNLNLLPAKGVTLPFVSYGRSSLARDRDHAWHDCRLDAAVRVQVRLAGLSGGWADWQ